MDTGHAAQRVALVAGATRGAGRAIAVELARAGLYVYATGRSSRAAGRSEIGRPETIEETGDLMATARGHGTALVVDHEDPMAVVDLVAQIESRHARLDVVVNDIFGGDRYAEWDKPLWEHDLAGGLRMLRMGVDTHLITAHAALPLLLRSDRGLLVEMTDGTAEVNAHRERVGFFYDLVKANVSRIVLGLTQELRNRPVTALGVTPGWLRSENMLDKQEVSGSIPSRPTRTVKAQVRGLISPPDESSAMMQSVSIGLYSGERTYLHLADARDSWLRALQSEGASPATLEIYSSAVDRLVDYLQAHHRPTDVAKVTRSDVQGFLTHLQATRSQATAHNRFRALRAFFNYCSEGSDERTLRREPLGVIEHSPMHRMAPPKLDEKPVPLLSPEQIEDLWAWTERPGRDLTRRRDSAIVRMFLATGVRASEMANLRLDDLDLRAQMATVAGKGRKWRRVPYSGAAATALDRYLAVRPTNRWADRSDHVWLGVKGHVTRSGIQQMLERVGAQVGIEGLHPHLLRHVFVDAAFSAGMSESEVMALMGWSSAAMCRRYAAARREARAVESYRRLGIGDPLRRR